ncbi:MAG: cytidylyltransferase domain-containing protein [Aestuariibacter sp.]
MTEIVAIIPARSGSKSVQHKNIAMLDGHPLIAYSIVAAKLSKRISRVIVSTDSEQYRDISLAYGAEVPFLRPKELATDQCDDKGFLQHAMHWLQEQEGACPEYWVHLRPTTPLRDPHLMDQAIETLVANNRATSLRSAHPAPESPFKWFRKQDDGYFTGLSDAMDDNAHTKPKEAFETAYIPDGYVDVVRKSVLMNDESIHGDRILGFISPVCTEVDSAEELEYLTWQVSRSNSLLKQALNNIKQEMI